MPDLTLPDAREDRDQLAARTDVLDKVGVLATLPDDMHANADQVATFYGTTREVIRQVVLRNKDEFDADGYRVLARAEVSDELSLTPDELGMPRTAPSMSLFPRRAVVRVGMLLRDSPVARQVRDYLLDTERDARPTEMTEDQMILASIRILDGRVRALTEEVAELKPRAEVADRILEADGDFDLRDAAQSLTRAGIKLGRQRLFKLLNEHYDWIFRSNADGRWRVRQTAIEAGFMSVIPQSHYHPKTGVLVLDPPQPRVTPKGLQRILSDHTSDGAA